MSTGSGVLALGQDAVLPPGHEDNRDTVRRKLATAVTPILGGLQSSLTPKLIVGPSTDTKIPHTMGCLPDAYTQPLHTPISGLLITPHGVNATKPLDSIV